MSWWDTSGITSLASQALKNAQKKIDKVLDIDEGASGKKKGLESNTKIVTQNEGEAKEVAQDGDFWSAWLGSGGKKSDIEENTAIPSSPRSSWSNPWSMAGSISEHTEEIGSSITESHKEEKPKTELQTLDLSTAAIQVGSLRSFLPAEPKNKPSTAKASETKIEHSSKKSNVLCDIDKHSTHTEQTNVLSSDNFMMDWKDFPLDGDVSEPVGDSPIDHDMPALLAKDNESPQKLSEKIDLVPLSKGKIESVVPEGTDEEKLAWSNNAFSTGAEKVSEDQSLRTDENDFKNASMQRIDNNSEPITNVTLSTTTVWPSSSVINVDNDSLQEQVLLQNLQLESDFLSEHSLSYDDIGKLDIRHFDILSKASSSSSFIAVSEENVTEVVSSHPSSMPGSDINFQGSSPHVREPQTDVTELQVTVSEHISGLSTPEGDAVEESIPVSFDTLQHQVSITSNLTSNSGASFKYEKELPKNTETVLPESMMNSDYQRYQSDFMQEYVNISAVNDSSQTVSFDGCAILPDDLHISNDMDMGNSRTSSDLDLPGGGRASSTGSSDTSKFDSSIDTVVDRSVLDSQSDVDLMERDPPYSLFEDSQTGGIEVGTSGVSQLGQLNDSSQSLSSSYVKCMIEEAMEDLSKTEDSGSDNHSSGEKSESSKVDSELEKSVYSGHESSDEIETTTSSDIEIISAPTPNGDNKYHIPFDLSPLKIALQRSGRDQGHNRSDSQSSSSAHSKAGEMDRLSPERGEGTSWRDDDFHHHDLHAVREEGTDNPSHPERLLKLAQLVVQRKLLGGQKLAEMAEVLQARENKLVQLSKENHQLTEDNNILRNQLQQSEEARELETADLTGLTEEFAVRIRDAEKKIQAVIKEKEILKQKLTTAEKELERRSANSGLEDLLEEKKLQVEELLKEGEKLSKKELQNGIIIKKLRAKEKECDTTIAAQKKKLEEQVKELERLTTVLDSKEDVEKKQSEAINQLNAAVQRQEKDLIKYKSDLEDAQEKCRGLQVALDNSYKEIAELHRSNASQDSKAQEAALSAETHVREELKAAMEREQQRFKQEREAFIMQIDDLRLDMARLEKEHSRREDLLRQEITHLQERQQQDEARSQDLTQSVTSATRPLLRQIENLQATFGAQSSAWERVEKNLTDRLAEAQTALAMAQEKERTANDHLMELSARVASLEAANSRIKQERAQLAAQVESDRSRLEELQDIRNSAVAELESGKQRLTQELTQLKMDKVHLESQLNVERTRLENERKKTLALEEQLRQAERPRSRGTPSPSPSMSVSRQESLAGSMYEHHSPGTMSWSFHDENESVSTFAATKTSVYDSLRQSGAAIVFENLSSQLKLREGEITHMQSEIVQLERTRESMARELVNLTNQNDELLEMKKAHEQLQEQFNELNNRYSAILQMYGEKEEQVQELRLDLQDVKEMYKSQIDALLAK